MGIGLGATSGLVFVNGDKNDLENLRNQIWLSMLVQASTTTFFSFLFFLFFQSKPITPTS
jgi:hypothetical protein